MSNDTLYIYIYNPELVFLKKKLLGRYFWYFSKISISLNETVIFELISSPIIMFPQFLIVIYFATIFIVFYFNFYSSSTKEESIIDADYLVSSTAVEAEKEITAFDDIILGFVVLVYLFGWYFYIHCWSLLCALPEIGFLFYLFPAFYFIIFAIPTLLAYNFGIYFLAYLRGVGTTPIISYELLNDYVYILIFYTRIGVQAVRLVIMFIAFTEVNEYIVMFSFPQRSFVCPELFW
jgi:hypothetical protein